ncbi:type IV pilus modification protein PilV [Pseudoalteromonas denitrificans]|uniref:Type IV pilus assembly protein PilV n=1 Tax=Pseudoalteromonas denitrificans DSM 6059 TaxID=1123010 RepID=A0A1I1R369_9GAMM|nr:type IV pilus modification protein PilV [Pseudoalteromonas denitrificans]SFD24710.1 type IV pilus assembly protein PilV [Pseudoalteromonas denitrificans DSM 6059]
MNDFKFKGFTLLETLIAFIVLTIGLLGAVALQAKAKQASFDSLQRAAALSLSKDILQRISINDTANVVALYNRNFSSSEAAITPSPNCINVVCTPTQMATFDIEEWKKQIKAQEHTGTLANANVCISATEAIVGEITLQIVVSWEGRQKITQNAANSAISCGSTSSTRRIVVMNSFVSVRS